MARSRKRKNKGLSSLKVLNFNINGLVAHQKTLLSQMVDNDYDVITLQETLTTKEVHKSLLISGYQRFHLDKDPHIDIDVDNGNNDDDLGLNLLFQDPRPPPNRGLATYVKTTLKASKSRDQTGFCDKGEFLVVNIKTQTGTTKIMNYYISPSYLASQRTYNFSDFLSDSFLLIGDANADPAHSDTAQGEHLANALEAYPFVNLFNDLSPTNFTGSSSSRIDLVFSSDCVSTTDSTPLNHSLWNEI